MSDTPNVPKTWTNPTTGKFAPGNPGGGRTPLPEWLKGKGEELLRVQLRAALEGVVPRKNGDKEHDEPVEAKDQLAAAEKLIDRIYGKAPQSVDVGGEGMTTAGAALVALAMAAKK